MQLLESSGGFGYHPAGSGGHPHDQHFAIKAACSLKLADGKCSPRCGTLRGGRCSFINMVTRTDGVLIAGAKHRNPIHAPLTRERDPGSPVWLPIFDSGRSVRFVNRGADQAGLEVEWFAPRIVYLQHPSDPTVFWSIEALWRPPKWMEQPRGFDVPYNVRWFPIVSGVQAVADMLNQLSPPPGFGHVYSTDYVRAWASILPPEGWKEGDTTRLEQFLQKVAGDEAEP